MRRYFGSLCLMVSAVFFFASCLSTNEEEVTLYSDTAITSFQISTAKITQHTTSSTGSDSTYITTSSLTDYPFYIDQLNGLIFNVDSLPMGTDATKMLCSYASKNNGMVYLENVTRDSLKYLSTTDSIDFSSPRYLRVYASDGSSYKTYKITVNIHKEAADSFKWLHIADNSEIAGLTGMKAVSYQGKLLLFGSNGNTTSIFSCSESDGKVWTKGTITLGGNAYNNVAVSGKAIYVLDDGTLKKSTDGATFDVVSTTTGLQQLLGGSSSELYARSAEGHLTVSTDNGLTWSIENIADESLLPTTDIAFCTSIFKATDSTDYVVMAGSRSLTDYPTEANASVWTKIVEYAQNSEKNDWIHISTEDAGLYSLPRLSNLNVFAYDNNLIALGGAGMGGCAYGAFSNVYESKDGGITWKRNAAMALPQTFDTTTTAFTTVVDQAKRIWILCGKSGQIWRGQLNSFVWEN